MKFKVTSFFGPVFLGTILFWGIVFGLFELWINAQPETTERGRIEIDSVTGEKRIYIEEKTVYKEEVVPHPDSAQYREEYLGNVERFGELRIGEKPPQGLSVLEFVQIPESNFYVYVQRRGFSSCSFDTCDFVDSNVVQCMGGWLTGDGYAEQSHLLGLDSASISQGKASIVLVLDKDDHVIGIFPNHTEADIIPILDTFPGLKDSLYNCIDEEIGLSSVRELRPLERSAQVPDLSGAELQVWTKKSKKTAILMPDGSLQDSRGQILYEHYFDPSEKNYLIYRTGYGYYVKKNEDSEVYLSFSEKEAAIEWIKNEMKGRGYSIINF